MSLAGIEATAVKADVPDALTYPVRVVAPVPPLPTGSVPVTPVVSGKPVALVNTPAVGVPRSASTNVLSVSVCGVSSVTAFSAGYATNTSLLPAANGTLLPELLEASTVSRVSVLTLYVPIPTSQSPVALSTAV